MVVLITQVGLGVSSNERDQSRLFAHRQWGCVHQCLVHGYFVEHRTVARCGLQELTVNPRDTYMPN